MITKCPHCSAKFKARDDWKDKKTKCPKCEQSFTIEEFIADARSPVPKTNLGKKGLETCTYCMATIGRLETTHVFNKMVVCARCYKDLQSDLARSSRSSASGSTPFQSLPTKGDRIRRANEQLKVFRVLLAVLNPLCIVIIVGITFVNTIGHEKPPVASGLQALASIWLLISGILYFILWSRSKGK